ncbi:MAG: PEP-CTERM sorting domain-containing protein [Spongiibacteraceae bacterium]
MKKTLIAGLLATLPLLANAYTQTIDFNPDPKITWLSTYSYTHDLTTDGFIPGTNTIAGYSLKIDLYNDAGMLDAIYINQPGITGDSAALLYNWTYASLTTGDSYQGVASINSNGLLNVSLTSLLGTFFLDSSTLTAKEGSSQAVPEPTSVALLAAGLLGIAVMRRKSQNAA